MSMKIAAQLSLGLVLAAGAASIWIASNHGNPTTTSDARSESERPVLPTLTAHSSSPAPSPTHLGGSMRSFLPPAYPLTGSAVEGAVARTANVNQESNGRPWMTALESLPDSEARYQLLCGIRDGDIRIEPKILADAIAYATTDSLLRIAAADALIETADGPAIDRLIEAHGPALPDEVRIEIERALSTVVSPAASSAMCRAAARIPLGAEDSLEAAILTGLASIGTDETIDALLSRGDSASLAGSADNVFELIAGIRNPEALICLAAHLQRPGSSHCEATRLSAIRALGNGRSADVRIAIREVHRTGTPAENQEAARSLIRIALRTKPDAEPRGGSSQMSETPGTTR